MNYDPKPTPAFCLGALGMWANNHTVPRELRQVLQGLVAAHRDGELALITPPVPLSPLTKVGDEQQLFSTIYGPEGLCYVTVHQSKVDDILAIQTAELMGDLDRVRKMDALGGIFMVTPAGAVNSPRARVPKRNQSYSDVVKLIGINNFSKPRHLRTPFITADIHWNAWDSSRDHQLEMVETALSQALLQVGLSDLEWYNRMNERVRGCLASTNIVAEFNNKAEKVNTKHRGQMYTMPIPIQIQLFNEGADQFMKILWIDEFMFPEVGYVLPFQDVHQMVSMNPPVGSHTSPSFVASYGMPPGQCW